MVVFVIYILGAIVLGCLYEKIFPYNSYCEYSDSQYKRKYYQSMALGVVLWPMLLLTVIILWLLMIFSNNNNNNFF